MGQSRQVEPSPQRLPELLASTVSWLGDSDIGADIEGLTPAELLQVVDRAEAIKASVAAVQARASVEYVEQQDANAAEAAARGEATAREVARRRQAARSQVALARRCSPSQASRHVGLAEALVGELPATMAALTRGELSEWRATIVAKETACLDPADRREADARLAPDLTRLGDRAIGDAARRACIDLDGQAVAKRRSRAAASRCVSVRPAPDGMAYLSILGRMVDVVGAHASLLAAEKSRFVATGDPGIDRRRADDTRSRGAWLADTALERLSGRAQDTAQPVEVGLVMQESAFFPAHADAAHPGCGHAHTDDDDAPDGPSGASGARVAGDGAPGRAGGCRDRDRVHDHQGWVEMPGWGAIPASMAREHLLALLTEDVQRSEDRDQRASRPGCAEDDRVDEHGSREQEARQAGFWLRRLWTGPDGRDLVAMDSRRRFFSGGLRRLLQLRDPRCRVPWCDAPARQIDHVQPVSDGGSTSVVNGAGLCQCHNLVKEEPGWSAQVIASGTHPGHGPHTFRLTTPTGARLTCPAPPLLGTGRPPRSRPPTVSDHLHPHDHASPIEVIYADLLHAA